MPLTPVPAFVASYQSALAINDLITAILLFSQFSLLRSRALLLLASGYLFTAAAAVVHALTFPGLFAPAGLSRRRIRRRRSGFTWSGTADFRSSSSDMRCSGKPMAAPRYGLRPAGAILAKRHCGRRCDFGR